MLSKKPDVLKLIGVHGAASSEAVIAALQRGAASCSSEFLAVVAELQVLEEAVATELVRGRHALLAAKGGAAETQLARPAAAAGGKGGAADALGGKAAGDSALPHSAQHGGHAATGASSGALGRKGLAGTSMIAVADGERTHTFLSTRTAHGSTEASRDPLTTGTGPAAREVAHPAQPASPDLERPCSGEVSHGAEAASGPPPGFGKVASDFARRAGSGGGAAGRGVAAARMKGAPPWDGAAEGAPGMVAMHSL